MPLAWFRRAFATALLCIGAGAASAQVQTLYSFGGPGTLGTQPAAGLVMDGKGNLYGTTTCQQSSICDSSGIAFELSPISGGGWKETLLHAFGNGTTTDGSYTTGSLILDAEGNVYGTTLSGGANNGAGTVFELSPGTDGTWAEKILYDFGGADNAYGPTAALVFDAKGNLYGVTEGGGANGDGVVFKLTPAASGPWTETNLYSFGATLTDGQQPQSTLVFDSAGNLYGTTEFGGANAAGTVFELIPPKTGTTWTEKILYSFGATSTDGQNPVSGVVFDTKGNLYGTTEYGGPNPDPGVDVGPGTVYELVPSASGAWTEKILHTFNFTGDGNEPWDSLLIDSSGNLYGTTTEGGNASQGYGGTPGAGIVFRLSPEANGEWTETVLANFGPKDETNPSTLFGSVIMDAAGNLYSTSGGGGIYQTCSTQFLSEAGAVFEIPAGQPVLTPAPAYYHTPQSVVLTAPIAGSAIYYTTDGTTPTEESAQYSSPIQVATGSKTIKAIAVPPGKAASGVSTGVYTIYPSALPPTFSPPPGSYASPQTVTISSPLPCFATIFYTTDGTTPADLINPFISPLTVSSSETLKAIASGYYYGFGDSSVVSATYAIGNMAFTPTFSPPAGTYNGAQTVTITSSTPKATIYYTTDGSTPTTSSTKYTGPFLVSASEQLSAIAVAAGSANSGIGYAYYTIQTTVAATPTFSPAAGTYASAQTVTIADTTSGATIYYTTNGTTPTTASTKYTAAIAVPASETIKAIAVAPGHTNSAVASAAYVIAPLAATPVFSPAAGSYTTAQSVKITSTTPGATIYYTTNGTTPTTASTKYTAAIKVTASETIRAFAVAAGHTHSAVASAAYVIAPLAATPVFSPAAGTYTTAQSVKVTSTTPGATIYYTTNGSSPTTASTKYTAAIKVTASETIRAFAVAAGHTHSAVASAAFVIEKPADAPVFSPVAGTYATAQSVKLTSATTGATIYYTTNGTTPTTASTKYTAAIKVATSETIRAIAVQAGYSESAEAVGKFVIQAPAIARPVSSSQ